MPLPRRHLLATALALAFAPRPAALAQTDWPAKPIRIIVPTPPGGAFDRVIRPIAQELAALLKQPVVVENKPGGGNILGAHAGAMAAPDGYTLTMTGMINTIAQGMYDKVPFHIVTDFAHIGAIGGGAQWLVVHSNSGISSLADLIERARRTPGKLFYATSGQGSTGHLMMEQLQRSASIKLEHVPYKGGAPALQDVLAGVVPITVVPIAGALQHVQGGRLKALAVSSPERSSELPQVPTFAEQGHQALTVASWVGLSAPKDTPRDIVARMHGALTSVMGKPELLKQLEADGLVPMPMSQAAFAQLVRSDTERWGELTRSLGLKAQ
jgi:tripartite-type tricarboxylate transporter receptor subunit TctC